MKKGIVALAFIFGFYFVHAQDKYEKMSDMDTEQSTEYRDYNFDTEETSTDTDLKKSNKEVVVVPEESTETGKAKVKEKKKVKKDDSFVENVVEAPFKFVGTTVGEVGRGVGHIVWAPFKGVINLFDGDSKEKKKAKLEYSEQVSNENASKIQNEETFEAKSKTDDGKYKYNSSYDSEESGNSTDTDYMYIR
jgi:hypothetical protein